MNDELNKSISKINDNIAIMPHKTVKDRKKYQEYLNNLIKDHQVKLNLVQQEINKRYNNNFVEPNPKINELINKKIDIKTIREKDSQIPLINKLGLDNLFYQLKHFYKDDLGNVNMVILNIIKIFKDKGINLTANDFKYNSYVSSYISLLMNEGNNYGKIHNYFDSIYWKCPMIINAIELNFEFIFLKYQDSLDKALKLQYNNIDTNIYLNTYLADLAELRRLKNNDRGYILNKFITKKLILSDYNDASITKLEQNILLDVQDTNNYNNLSKLCSTLDEYKKYLAYKFIIDDVLKKYQKKEEAKGKYSAKLKEISKQESKLFGLNKKLNATGFFKLKDSKIEQVSLEINNCINNLANLYQELNDLRIDDAIYNKLSNESKIYDVLMIAANDYNYFAKLLKEQDDNVTLDVINNRLYDLQKFLIITDFDIINNIGINSDINIVQMIVDRYKLVNLDITEENIDSDNLDGTIKNIKTLLNYFVIQQVGLSYNKIHFMLDSYKILKKE